jgi:16S rRNA (guanine(1405)-N(7))-methyltransferase
MRQPCSLEILTKLAESKKYRHLCPDTLKRVARWAAANHSGGKEAEKAAKRKLHQIYAAYMNLQELRKIERLVEEAQIAGGPGEIQQCCLRILDCHASSRERIPHLAAFYEDIKRLTGEPKSILDLSCGLNPFTLPWLAPKSGATYRCLDIDCRLIEVISRFLQIIHAKSSAVCRDILVSPPNEAVDMALLLKSLPCLEQQESNAGTRLLQSLKARHIIVSFPARSLSGRDVGMVQHYERLMERIVAEAGAEFATLSYPNETVYVMRKSR